MTPTSVFVLGRMRKLDLLALYCQAHPNSRERDMAVVGRMSKERLAVTVLGTQAGAR